MALLVALSFGAEDGVAVVAVEGEGSFKPTRWAASIGCSRIACANSGNFELELLSLVGGGRLVDETGALVADGLVVLVDEPTGGLTAGG